jgi:hypothetical protein
MTAMSSGGQPSGIPNPLSSASERLHAGESGPRPLDQILPMEGDANRTHEMQAAWKSFCRDRLSAVRGVLAAAVRRPRSPINWASCCTTTSAPAA